MREHLDSIIGRTVVAAPLDYGTWFDDCWEGSAVTLTLDDGTEVEFAAEVSYESPRLEVRVTRPAPKGKA